MRLACDRMTRLSKTSATQYVPVLRPSSSTRKHFQWYESASAVELPAGLSAYKSFIRPGSVEMSVR